LHNILAELIMRVRDRLSRGGAMPAPAAEARYRSKDAARVDSLKRRLNMEDFKGKTAFITGAASGIGLGIAKACGKAGMNVVIADLRKRAIDEVLPYFRERGWPVHGIQLDVTDREAYQGPPTSRGGFRQDPPSCQQRRSRGPKQPALEVVLQRCRFHRQRQHKGVINGI
jgi:hypothetical protein